MICKKDVISWFKELESYKRIDTMCALLNMCLPFELRFLGTCLEELGRRDSQELRGIELRVNNPQDLAIDMAACQKGEPSDKKIRRKMALYLALIRACNRSCVTEIFKTLDGWGKRDFTKLNDSDTLQELLLVYTMAANHPVFTFEQHMTCAAIFEKIKENKLVADYREQMKPVATPTELHNILGPSQHQQAMHMHTGQQPSVHAPIQVVPQSSIPMSFSQAHISKMIPTDGTLQHHITVDGIAHMLSSNITIPAELTLAHTNAWSVRPNMQNYPAASVEPQSSSPMLSQQSSPSNSRSASPNRTSGNNLFQGPQQQQQQTIQQARNLQHRPGIHVRAIRRPSAEITPPPVMQQHPQLIGNMNNEIIATQNIKNLDDTMSNSENSKTPLQAIIRNGYAISRLPKSAVNVQHHNQIQQQPPQHQPFQSLQPSNLGINSSLAYTLQNVSLSDGQHPQIDNNMMSVMKNAGSDSGSSIGSSGEITPPETPTLIANTLGNLKLNEQQQKLQQASHKQQQQQQQQQQPQQMNYNKLMTLARVNGRSDKLLPINVGANTGTSTFFYPPATSPQQHYMASDIILTSGPNIIQSSLTNNNHLNQVCSAANDAGSVVVCSAGIANSNLSANTVLITSPSAINAQSGGVISKVITSNSVILQPAQHQHYSAAHPYHAQHITSAPRTPIIPHSHGIAGPPPHGTFRLPSFQIPSSGELIYPYHPAGITFLPGTAPPSAAPAVRSSPSTSVPPPTTTNVIQLPQPPPQQQQSVLPQMQTNPLQQTAALLPTSPYTSLSVGINKQLSCYNCGSQMHNGRDCNEASMEDVTRGGIYKLDYSISSPISPIGPQSSGENLTGNNSNCSSCNQQSVTTIEVGTESLSPTASSSSSSLSTSNINMK